ncbi:MAG: lysostaphin resistance A-like protein [Stackebrandtia sp.]
MQASPKGRPRPSAGSDATAPRRAFGVDLAAVWAKLSRNRRFLTILAAILAVLAAVNVANRFGPVGTGLVLGPTVAVALLTWARRHGLSWHELGLSRRTWVRGVKYAAAAVGVVAGMYLLAAAFPATREMFLDSRYRMAVGAALLTSLVIVPLSTVLLEEVAFRGVLMGWLSKHKGIALGMGVSSATFGLWHVLPSLGMSANQVVAGLLGSGLGAKVVIVLGVVAFTALAGWLLCEVRRRSGSLIAAAGLHWAVNGLAVLLASVVWSGYLT